MAIYPSADQYKYTGRGPLDSKALVKTYTELFNAESWTVDEKIIAYNGMITAVWLNKDDVSKNGVYFLYDSSVTKALQVPDFTVESNWHKLCDISSVEGINSQVAELSLRADGIDALLEEQGNSITALETNYSALVDEDTRLAALISSEINAEKLEREALAIMVETNTNAIAKLNGTEEGSVQKIVADAIAALPIATNEIAGIVKASEEILVAEDGTMELGVVSTDKLVKGANTLVLNGGTSDEDSE